MAAVLCLVMIPVFAAVGFMFGAVGGESGASALGGLVFLALAAFTLLAAVHMARAWDEERPS